MVNKEKEKIEVEEQPVAEEPKKVETTKRKEEFARVTHQ